MKRVIRGRATGLYFGKDGSWTDDSMQAEDFPGFQEALSAQQRYHLQDCDLVLQMGPQPSAQYDVVLPLSTPRPYQKSKGPKRNSQSSSDGEDSHAWVEH